MRKGFDAKIVLLVILLGFSFVPLVSSQEDTVPPKIIDKAKEYIISNVGEDYFNTYFHLKDSMFIPESWRPENNPNETYMVVFDYNISIGDYSATIIAEMHFDSEGNITRAYGIPTEGYLMPFKIDREEAIRIASKAGLPSGTVGYTAQITHMIYQELNAYVWAVETWLTLPPPNSDPAKGMYAMIDVKSGKVYGIGDMFAMSSGGPTGSFVLSLTLSYLTLLHIETLLSLAIGFGLYYNSKHGTAKFPRLTQRITQIIDLTSEGVKKNIRRAIALLPIILLLYGLILLADELVFVYRYFQVLTIGPWLWIAYRIVLSAAVLCVSIMILTAKKAGIRSDESNHQENELYRKLCQIQLLPFFKGGSIENIILI